MTGRDEEKVLALLAKEWVLRGPPGILDVSDVVAALPLAPSDAMASLKVLYRTGMIDMNSEKTAAFLTPEGFAAAGRLKRRNPGEGKKARPCG